MNDKGAYGRIDKSNRTFPYGEARVVYHSENGTHDG